MKLISQQQFSDLFIRNTPMLDVRAPIEFSKGAFVNAVNLPILDDHEREQVGTCYKLKGSNFAVELGHQLVSGENKQTKINQWLTFCRENPEAVLYCFRGGQRSQLAQQWLHESGKEIAKVEGGYKALRHFLLETIESFCQRNKSLWVVGGRTGSGKTRVIHAIDHSLDLEGYANHRGSAFGQRASPQPSQIDFENTLAIDLLKKTKLSDAPLLVEDESKLIGKSLLPPSLKQQIQKSDLLVIEEPIESRIQVVIDEYVVDLCAEHLRQDPVNGCQNYQNYLLASLNKLQKRLGDNRYQELDRLMRDALKQQQASQKTQLHGLWIEPLLSEYYDKMYDYQLQQKQGRILYKGTRSEIIEFVQQNQKG